MALGHNEWFANESIWKDLYPFTFPESAFAVAEEQVEKILRLTGVRGGQVLDLCCGPGRHVVAVRPASHHSRLAPRTFDHGTAQQERRQDARLSAIESARRGPCASIRVCALRGIVE